MNTKYRALVLNVIAVTVMPDADAVALAVDVIINGMMMLLRDNLIFPVALLLLLLFVSSSDSSAQNELTKCIRRSVCTGRGPIDFFVCIERALAPTEPLRFVQVGANDGKMLDPLHPVQMTSVANGRRWLGVFVEPVERMMSQLKINKAKLPDVHFVRAVVTQKCVNGTIDFFELNQKAVAHEHFQGMGALVKPKRSPEFFNRVSLPCIRSMELAAVALQHGAKNPHILMVDIEGHDISFLLTLAEWPFGKPLMIAFEVWEAPGKLPPNQQHQIFKFLNSHGYLVLKCGNTEDYVALQQMPWPH